MSTIDQVVEGVGGGRLVGALLHLAEADVVDDEQVGAGPSLEALGVRPVREASMQVVEEVDAARVAHAEALLARAKSEGLEDVALAGAGLAGDHEVVLATDEVEAPELEHERLVESGLEGPVEGLECLALDEPAGDDSSLDALRQSLRSLEAEDAFE